MATRTTRTFRCCRFRLRFLAFWGCWFHSMAAMPASLGSWVKPRQSDCIMRYVLGIIYVGICWNMLRYGRYPLIKYLRTASVSILGLAVLSGCTTTVSDDSKHAIFAPYVGKSFALQREQRLCEMENDPNFYAFRRVRLAGLSEACPRQLMTLPRGSVVTVDRVLKQWMPVSGAYWYALGHVDGTDYHFEYPWAYLYMARAPWEPNSVPAKRPPPE